MAGEAESDGTSSLAEEGGLSPRLLGYFATQGTELASDLHRPGTGEQDRDIPGIARYAPFDWIPAGATPGAVGPRLVPNPSFVLLAEYVRQRLEGDWTGEWLAASGPLACAAR